MTKFHSNLELLIYFHNSSARGRRAMRLQMAIYRMVSFRFETVTFGVIPLLKWSTLFIFAVFVLQIYKVF